MTHRRRQGGDVATGLLNAARTWSREAGLARVELTVHPTNQRAIAAYQRAGFQIEGTRRRALLVGGKYVDEYLMSLLHEA